MWLKIQKILQFIPVANFIPFFYSSIFTIKNSVSSEERRRETLLSCVLVVIFAVSALVLNKLIQNETLRLAIYWTLAYGMTVGLAHLSVKLQERIISKPKKALGVSDTADKS